MALQSEEKGTVKEICYRMFERGFDAYEIIKIRKYNRDTVLYYRSRYRNESIDKWIKQLKNDSCMSSYKREFSKEEMDYGYTLPKYNIKDLVSVEKSLIRKEEHAYLKQIDYEGSRL